MSTLNENSSIANMVFFIIIMSIGNGLYQSPITSLIMSAVPRDKLGIVGSINALTRNLGTACGIALSTIILYSMMSYKVGYQVTDYVVGRNDAFIYGMRIVHITAAGLCMIGAILIALRLFSRKDKLANSLELGNLEEFN